MIQTLSIIIPVYNEEKRILNAIDAVLHADTLKYRKEIIIVDDGSTDNTTANLKFFKAKSKQKDITILFKRKNGGKGSALKAGFQKASGDILLIQDADEEYSVNDYPALLSMFEDKNTKVVYGSRNSDRAKYNTSYSYFSFYWGGIFLTWFMNFLFGTHLTDQATGYKVFRNDLKKLALVPRENRFSYEVALTGLFARKGIEIKEVPIHYVPRSFKEGKKIRLTDFIASMWCAVKYRILILR